MYLFCFFDFFCLLFLIRPRHRALLSQCFFFCFFVFFRPGAGLQKCYSCSTVVERNRHRSSVYNSVLVYNNVVFYRLIKKSCNMIDFTEYASTATSPETTRTSSTNFQIETISTLLSARSTNSSYAMCQKLDQVNGKIFYSTSSQLTL